jgi:hypothetical protein
MNGMTKAEAVRWLLGKNNRKKWNVGEKKMSSQNLNTIEHRLNDGKLGEKAMKNLIENSGIFEIVEFVKFKNESYEK